MHKDNRIPDIHNEGMKQHKTCCCERKRQLHTVSVHQRAESERKLPNVHTDARLKHPKHKQESNRIIISSVLRYEY